MRLWRIASASATAQALSRSVNSRVISSSESLVRSWVTVEVLVVAIGAPSLPVISWRSTNMPRWRAGASRKPKLGIERKPVSLTYGHSIVIAVFLREAYLRCAGLGTQLALAYAIHKSFIFIRVPLTAAILPKVVKVLRSWGWNIGKKAKP